MSKAPRDPTAGWFGLAIGIFFIGLAIPGLLAYFSGDVPSLSLKHVRLVGFDALAASVASAVGGLYALAKGLALLRSGRRHEA